MMTMTEALRLIPRGEGYHLVLNYRRDDLSANLMRVPPTGLGAAECVAGVTSSPPDDDRFEEAIVQMLVSRFDPSYDECEWKPKSPYDGVGEEEKRREHAAKVRRMMNEGV